MMSKRPTSPPEPVPMELAESSGVITYAFHLDAMDLLANLEASAPMALWNSIHPGGIAVADSFTPTLLVVELAMTHTRPVLDVYRVTASGTQGTEWRHVDYPFLNGPQDPDIDPPDKLGPDHAWPQLWQAPLWVRHVTASVLQRATGSHVNPAVPEAPWLP